MQKKYKLVDVGPWRGIPCYRIEALRSFGNVKKGDGGRSPNYGSSDVSEKNLGARFSQLKSKNLCEASLVVINESELSDMFNKYDRERSS